MQLIRPVIAPGMLGHTASLVVGSKKSCDIQPRRPHLYKKRKGGPAPFNESEMALFSECMQSCARKVLDTADIVREA